MKKQIFLFAAIIVMAAASAFGQGFWRNSRIKSGDKTSMETAKVCQLLSDQIETYSQKAKELKERNERIVRELSADSASNLSSIRLRQELLENDSLVAVYNSRSGQLQGQIDAVLVASSARQTERRTNLRSGDPRHVAQADVMLAYSEQMRKGTTNQSSSPKNCGEILLVNQMYWPVVCSIIDPVGISREISLPANKSMEINWGGEMIPGQYVVKFIGHNINTAVVKTVGPLDKYQGAGKSYDLMATLVAY